MRIVLFNITHSFKPALIVKPNVVAEIVHKKYSSSPIGVFI